MGLTKEQTANYRQSRILKIISEPGEHTGSSLAKKLGTTIGVILKDIGELRRKGYPIQTSSMKAEDGMYQATFELLKMPAKS